MSHFFGLHVYVYNTFLLRPTMSAIFNAGPAFIMAQVGMYNTIDIMDMPNFMGRDGKGAYLISRTGRVQIPNFLDGLRCLFSGTGWEHSGKSR